MVVMGSLFFLQLVCIYVRAVPELSSGGVGRKHFFVQWGGGCFVDNVSRGVGGVRGNLSWGSRHS